MKILLAIAGMPGSGKSIVTEVARELGICVVSMGDAVRREVLRRGLTITLETMLKVATDLRRERGPHAVAELVVNDIERCPTNVVALDGVRSLEEVEYLRSRGYRVIIIAVHASPTTRFHRLKLRKRVGDPTTWNEFVERDLRELSWGLGNVIALADYMLVNECDLNEFKNLVRKTLREVLREHGVHTG